MEAELLKALPNLGIGIAAIYVLYLVFRESIKVINERDRAFKAYVEANNHESVKMMERQVTMMEKCETAIKVSADNIKAHTEAHRQLTDTQNRLLESLIKK